MLNTMKARPVVISKGQMAQEYGVCLKTFNRMLMRNNIHIERRLITPKEQRIIYTSLGVPQNSGDYPIMPKNAVK
jgi:hypothetical protein